MALGVKCPQMPIRRAGGRCREVEALAIRLACIFAISQNGYYAGFMDDSTLSEITGLDFRWPKTGDTLFSNRQPASAACSPREAEERLYHLMGGYKVGADLLVEQTEAEPWQRRKLIYPVVFCYRQFLELTLKSILAEFGPAGGIEPNWSSHKLEYLWERFVALLRSLGAEDPTDATAAVEHCIAEFAKIDPSSDTFRYPHDRKGQPFGVDDVAVDLLHLRDTMQAIENYFMGCEGFLGELLGAHE